MAQDVTIAGISYPLVPAIDVPKTGGGTARFLDPTGTKSITANGTHDVTNFASAQVNVTGVWDSVMPAPLSITPISVTWKDNYRLYNGADAAYTGVSITNEYIDMHDWTDKMYLLVVTTGNAKIGDHKFNTFAAFYNESMIFNDNFVVGNYNAYFKAYAIQRNPLNSELRAYIRLQAQINRKPTAVYKVTFP